MLSDTDQEDWSGGVYWLETCGEPLFARTEVTSTIDSDVAIVGGGYSGLWTAYYLLQNEPSLRVVVVEAHVCGWGASGRNGGGCGGRFSNEQPLLQNLSRRQRAELLAAQVDTVDEIGRVLRLEGIDAEFAKTGSLVVAEGRYQLQALQARQARASAAETDLGMRQISRTELFERVRIEGAVGAWFDPSKGVVHPGKLVRGLARSVERLGGIIYERSPVLEVHSGPKPKLVTRRGVIRARVVVVAAEGYVSEVAGMKRMLVPITSSIVLSEPLGINDWQHIGWHDREALSSFRLSVNYARRTADNRILFGGRGAAYRIGSAVDCEHNGTQQIYSELRRRARRWWPPLRDVKFTHAWSGVLGVPRDLTPSVCYDRSAQVLILGGYVGSGIGASNLFGRTAADLILSRETGLVHLPFVGHKWRKWEVEPLRWAGIRYVQAGLLAADRRAERTGRPPSGRTLAERLWKS